MTEQEIRNGMRRRLLKDVKQPVSLWELRRTEWNGDFEKLMRNRLLMGAYRYGRLGEPDKPRYDRLGAVRDRLEEYARSGNDELLVDCANLLMLEFTEGTHPDKHFRAADGGEHVRTINS